MTRQLIPYKGVMPRVDATAYVADGARIIGDVAIGAESSIWFNCVVRGDVNYVRIGAGSNVQDGSVIHVTDGGSPTIIGDMVLVGHMVLLHACTLEDGCLIGMGSTVMDDVVIETGAMLAAGSLVTPGKRIPSGELWTGRPAKYRRDLTPEETAHNRHLTEGYIQRCREYRAASG